MRSLVLTLGLLLVLAAPAAARSKADRCHPAGAKTVAGSGDVRVFARRGSVVACHFKTGRKLRLGTEAERAALREEYGVGANAVRVAGRYVAFVQAQRAQSSQGPFSADRLSLADAKRGRLVARPAVGCDNPAAPDRTPVVGGLGVTARGALAWGCTGGSLTEIHKLDASGPGVLDSRPHLYQGPDALLVDSIATSEAGWVYWQSQQAAHSARLG